jgi:hypothetical protein
MAESERKPELPTILIVILALFGITTIRGGFAPAPKPDQNAVGDSSGKPAVLALSSPSEDPDLASDGNTRTLRPLAIHFGLENEKRLEASVVYARIQRDREYPHGAQYKPETGILCLIVTVPDPIRTTNAHRFDEHLDAVQRGVETQDYVLDRYRIAWKEDEKPSSAPDDKPQTRPEGNGANRAVRTSKPDEKAARNPSPRRQPGVVLFRKSHGGGPLLLVLLVPESPTRGLDRLCLIDCLNLVREWDVRNRPRDAQEKAPSAGRYNILGPCFSGSQPSLERGLRDWLEERSATGTAPVEFNVISGMASSIDVAALEAAVVGSGHTLSFQATVHHTEEVLRALLDYVGQGQATPGDASAATNRGAAEPQVALLSESDTGFGRSFDLAKFPGATNLISYRFPSHISQLRSSYQRQGVFGVSATAAVGSAEQLTIPDGDPEAARDIIPSRTPGYSAAADELTLDQILTEIARRKIRKVGIVATDPRDVIFLAREVNRFCDDVQLFTPMNNLLFAHPQYAADLRGMLVGTTYLLYPRNQLWSDASRHASETRPHIFFPSNEAQGTYNASVAHLRAMNIAEPRSPGLLEYGIPALEESTGTSRIDPCVPPVWIGVVGNRGIYPVRAMLLPKTVANLPDKYHKYLYHNEACKTDSGQATSRVGYRPLFEVFWLSVFVTLTLAAITLAAVALIVARWVWTARLGAGPDALNVGPIPLARLAQFLNLCGLERSPRRDLDPWHSLDNLCMLIMLFLLCYANINYLLLRGAHRSGWGWTPEQLNWLWCAGIALATLIVLSAALGASGLTYWRLAPRQRIVRWVVLVLVMAIAIACAGGTLAAIVRPDHGVQSALDHWFMLERSLIVTSGVSSFYPMFFLVVAGAALVFNRLNDLYLLKQHMPPYLAPGPGGLVMDDPMWVTDGKLHAERDEYAAVVEKPSRCLIPRSGTHLVAVTLAAVSFAYFALPLMLSVLPTGANHSMEDPLFDELFGIIAIVLLGFVTLNTIRLTLMWKSLQKMIGLFLHLPVGSSLDRMSTRIARWFFEAPGPDQARFDLIKRQASTLAEACKPEVLASRKIHQDEIDQVWSAFLGDPATAGPAWAAAATFDQRWEALRRELASINLETVARVRAMLLPLVLAYWRTLTVEEAYPAVGSSAAGEGGPAGSAPAEPAAAEASLAAWGAAATDLLSLLLVSWLAVAMAQIWQRIGCLVLAVLALLLAVSSYPFGFQDRMMFGLFLLVLYLVLVIVRIILGINREELLKRIASTPGGLSLNTPLLSSLLTYIVPLVGTLAAVSLDLSDTFHTLLDPILRHLR